MAILLPRPAACVVALFAWSASVALFAQDAANGRIDIPGGHLNQPSRRVLEKAGWTLSGKARPVVRPPLDGAQRRPPDRAWQLASGAALSRSFEVQAIKPGTGKSKEFDPAQWRSVFSCALGLPPGAKGEAAVQVRLRRKGSEAAKDELLLQGSVQGAGWNGQVLHCAPAEFAQPGTWDIEIRVRGNSAILIDDICWTRVPATASGMRFAKPNGKNGPDILVSGALGFEGHAADGHVPLPVRTVRKDGPAARGGLQPGDLIVGIDGQLFRPNSCRPGWAWFERGFEAALGRAIDRAIATSDPEVQLAILRNGKPQTLALRPSLRPQLTESFPFDEKGSDRLYADLLAFVRKHQRPEGHWQIDGNDWIQTAFGGLALLGARDPQDAQRIQAAVEWMLTKFPDGESLGNLGYWAAGYGGIFLTEYWIASGDDRVRPWIERSLAWVKDGYHTTKWGHPGLGHGPNGLPYGQKALIAPAAHLLVFEALAVRAGQPSAIRETLWPYLLATWSNPADGGHGGLGYNPSYKDKAEFWSRTGLFALALTLRGEEPGMRDALSAMMEGRHAWMRNSHAYGYPGATWGLIGLAQTDPAAFQRVMQAWRPIYGGMWEPGHGLRASEAHMGSPYMGREGLVNLTTAALFSVRQKGLVMTGADPAARGWLRKPSAARKPGAVRLLRRADGKALALPVIPGEAVHFTLDGSTPDARSPRFKKPIAMPDGGIMRACVVHKDGKLGRVAQREYGCSKAGWRILEAGGAGKPEAAIARAQAWIDMDPRRPWQPDRGEGHEDWPLRVIIDLGEPQLIEGLRFSGPNPPRRVRFETRRHQNTGKGLEEAEVVKRELRFDAAREVRYLVIELTELAKNGRARFGELDLIWPALGVKRNKTRCLVPAREDGLRVRQIPSNKVGAKGKALELPAEFPPRTVLRLRLEDKSGKPVGPVRVFLP